MKKAIIITFALFLFLGNIVKTEAVTSITSGCYMCQLHDTYVKFQGKDSQSLQKKAMNEYGCTVYAVMQSCDVMTNRDGYTVILGSVK